MEVDARSRGTITSRDIFYQAGTRRSGGPPPGIVRRRLPAGRNRPIHRFWRSVRALFCDRSGEASVCPREPRPHSRGVCDDPTQAQPDPLSHVSCIGTDLHSRCQLGTGRRYLVPTSSSALEQVFSRGSALPAALSARERSARPRGSCRTQQGGGGRSRSWKHGAARGPRRSRQGGGRDCRHHAQPQADHPTLFGLSAGWQTGSKGRCQASQVRRRRASPGS